jgi:hypothetical protein
MANLEGNLGDYVTVSMAVEILGYPRVQTGRFYALVRKGLPTYKVGGMTLALASELLAFADLPADTSIPWPAKLAGLNMKFLHSRDAAASILGVTPRTVNRYADKGTLGFVDLAPWGGYALYQLGTVTPHPQYIDIDGWTIEAEVNEDGKLKVALARKDAKDAFCMLSFGNAYPRTTFFYLDEDSMPIAQVRIAGDLHHG